MKTIEPVLDMGEDSDRPIPKSSDYEAWCSSKRCAGNKYQVVLVKVWAPPRAVFCPRCKNALVWKKKGSR